LFKLFLLSFLLFSPFGLNLNALELSVLGAKENHKSYSTLHVKHKNNFLCQEIKNDFKEVTKIVCAFSKSPSQKIQTIENNFFNINTEIKDNTYFLIITPRKKIKLYPMIFNLSKDDTVFASDVKLSSHWMILGYEDKIPFIKKNPYSEMSINFPFTLEKNKLPYVGGLDLSGNPVYIKKVEDVSSYLKIKKLFKQKRYELTLDLIDEVVTKYPNTLFMAELLYFKIKVYMHLKNYDEIIDIAKIYLREYSSDENVAEVLALSSKSYSKLGMNIDATYFFDRLFSEHKNSVYEKWGRIYKGEMLEATGGVSKAVIEYKIALNTTTDLTVAADAALKLARLYLANSNAKESAKFIQKIAKAKPEYFAKYFKLSKEMMLDFAEIEDYISASTISKCLVDNVKITNDDHESLMRNVGVWLSNTQKKKEALEALNRYLNEYDEGVYELEVQVAKDSLFFQVNDENLTQKLDNYTQMINKYKNDSIGSRAVYEKANLLLENKMFNDVLDLEIKLLALDSIIYKDVNQIINDAAVGEMKLSLKNKKCNRVLAISTKYKIKLSNEWDDGIYECAMKGGDYTLARDTSDRNLKSKDLELRKKWLYRYINVDFATGNYKDVISASIELISLIQDDKESKYKKVYRTLFDTYNRFENTNGMMKSIIDIKKVYGKDSNDIDRYVDMVAMAERAKDNNLLIKYATEVMDIQKISDSYAQSPFIEFTLYQAYVNKENNNEALKVIKSLDKVNIKNSERARQKYLLGSIYSKLWREEDASKAYKEAIDADKESPWAELAKGASGI